MAPGTTCNDRYRDVYRVCTYVHRPGALHAQLSFYTYTHELTPALVFFSGPESSAMPLSPGPGAGPGTGEPRDSLAGERTKKKTYTPWIQRTYMCIRPYIYVCRPASILNLSGFMNRLEIYLYNEFIDTRGIVG